MFRTVLAFFIAALLGIVEAGFVRALPDAWSPISLTLFYLVALVTDFRERDAYVAAVGAGLTLDALSSLPAGSHVLTLIGVVAVTNFLFTHIFSHRSWTGTVGLNAAAFFLNAAALAFIRNFRAGFAGYDANWIPSGTAWQAFGAGLLTQTLTAVFVLAVLGILRRILVKRFILLR